MHDLNIQVEKIPLMQAVLVSLRLAQEAERGKAAKAKPATAADLLSAG